MLGTIAGNLGERAKPGRALTCGDSALAGGWPAEQGQQEYGGEAEVQTRKHRDDCTNTKSDRR